MLSKRHSDKKKKKKDKGKRKEGRDINFNRPREMLWACARHPEL